MRTGFWLPALMALAAAGPHPAQAAALHRYSVQVGESLDRLKVRACFDGAAPAFLAADTDGAAAYLEQITLPGHPGSRPPRADRIALPGLADDACIEYRVKLDAVRGGAQTGGPESRWVGRDLLTSIGDWFWRPPPEAGDIEISFSLPSGVHVSTPWEPAPAHTDKPAFRIQPTPAGWPGVVAIGRFASEELHVGGAKLRLAMLDGPPAERQARIVGWVESAARNVASLLGRFPVESLQVVVAPTPRGNGPVPWAYVSRGGGPGVHFFINPSHPAAELRRDWTATHEMSHLFLPYVAARDTWLAEGVPTYLQNLLMARGGVLEEREAWSRMIVGLQRAAKVAPGLTLAQASERAGVGGVYQRAYWGGAGVMLEADLRLRELSGGSQSLATALEGIARCCLAQNRRWPASELLDEMDNATGTTVFAALLRERVEVPEFPEFQSQLVRAGVSVSGGEVVLDDAAPLAEARRAMMRAYPSAKP
jgi:hypothetical protein